MEKYKFQQNELTIKRSFNKEYIDDEEEADSPDLQNETEKPFTREQNI